MEANRVWPTRVARKVPTLSLSRDVAPSSAPRNPEGPASNEHSTGDGGRGSRRMKPLFDLAEEYAAVVAAKAHAVREGDLNIGLAEFVRNVVEIALGIRLTVVDRRRQD